MATGGRKGGGDFLLDGRHLAGLFVLLVVVFGMVFTLGYMLGRSQYDPRAHAAVAGSDDADFAASRKVPPKQDGFKAEAAQTDPSVDAQATPNWDFFHSGDTQAPSHILEAPKGDTPQPAGASNANADENDRHTAAKNAAGQDGRLIPKGAIMLQVAALKSEADALALAQALQQKKLPAFVIPPGADNYYRVQVGPYKSAQAAAAGRDVLEAQGFKSITKR